MIGGIRRGPALRGPSSVDGKVGKRGFGVAGLVGITVGDASQKCPGWKSAFHVGRHRAMADVRWRGVRQLHLFAVAGVERDIPDGIVEQIPKMRLVLLILYEVVDDIQGESELAWRDGLLSEDEEPLGQIGLVERFAFGYSSWCNVDTDILWVLSERKLISVTAAEFENRHNGMLAGEPIEHLSLHGGEPTIRSSS
jgi:hypothetical protein